MRILLVAAKLGYQTRVFAEAGARLGFDVQLATDRCHILNDPWGDGALAIDFANPVESITDGPYDGIVAVGDAPAEAASRIAEALGLPFHSPAATRSARNKYLARQCFASQPSLLVPAFERVALTDAIDFVPRQFPCVAKPLTLSASRGVIRANNVTEFRAAVQRIQRIVGGCDGDLQVEEFIPGSEFAVEGLMSHGKLHVIAVFDKPDPLDGPFFEETIYVTPTRSGMEKRIIGATTLAAEALGLSHGPLHAEMRVNEKGVWMLEVAARPIGGLCGHVLQTASGRQWEDVILRHAAGVDDGTGETLRAGGSGVMMIPIPRKGVYRGVSGVEEACRSVTGIDGIEITAKEAQELIPLPEGASYLGFIFSHGATPADAEASLRAAHAMLKFDIATSLPIAPK